MAFTTAKISEMPLRSSLPLTSHSPSSLRLLFSTPKPSFRIVKTFSSTVRTTEHGGSANAKPPQHKTRPASSAPWLNKWPNRSSPTELPRQKVNDKVSESHGREQDGKADTTRYFDKDKGQSTIERIVLRLRNLRLGSDDEEEDDGIGLDGQDPVPAARGEEKLGDLLQREWVRPDYVLDEEKSGDEVALPWEKEEEVSDKEEAKGLRKRRGKAPSLAELTIEDEELKRLRRMGMVLRERISVPKAGITQAVLEKIHDTWRKTELVRLKFHEVLALDMKTAHEIVERRTGGLVLWRSGSVMVVYRGSNYKGPSQSQTVDGERSGLFIPEISSPETSEMRSGNEATSGPDKTEQALKVPECVHNMTEEEAEFHSLLDDLGPRFVEWWGTGVLPVDADLLPKTIPGYKTPFRLLPTGMRSRLTNAEITTLRKLAKSLPCHFALGRNRNHQGLALAIIKLWEKSSVAKIAVKRGIQNTNNKLMAEEIKRRTGGLVLWRSGSVMVVYRGSNYKGPSQSQTVDGKRSGLFIPEISSPETSEMRSGNEATSGPDKTEQALKIPERVHNMTEEEAAFHSLLDDLGPRFVEWWGTGVLPVDADLLPKTIPGYKTPFRLLPTGMRSRLTNAEITTLRKLAKTLPCHCALGRNRNHQGLALAIIKLWEKSSVAKIAVKRGIQNTNNKLMAEEIKTGTDETGLSSPETSEMRSGNEATSGPDKTEQALKIPERVHNMTEEEAAFHSLLDDLGPRFVEWWGTGVLPVDADLLPKTIPGYKTPFRLLPTGMRSRLTNAEITTLRKLAKSLPCHFALGRNRNHQGLALAIIKLWEKSSVAKIAVKRGIQNTNNKLMAEEIKNLTGGVLLLRNKYYIVIYRGKDFVPTSVAAALSERQELTKQVQDVEEKVRIKAIDAASSGAVEGQALAGTLAEFYEAQARWGREISAEEREKMIEEDSRAKNAKLVRRIEHKLGVAQAKKLRAEKLLSKIESLMLPAGPDYDQETITDEERVMFRRVGLRMKAYLPLGIRGVFDGVVENMHLHWKHRELVKLISKQKTLAFVEDTARLLEYESGGILVAIERVPKGYALIYYRGKNYRRPITLRPRNLLTKAKALKRSVAMQRHEALSQHISELEKNIEQMKSQVSEDEGEDEDEDSYVDSDGNGEDSDWENEE
ncbi:hypothetical protein C1H46_023785 [Malus baccata]|uniref:CRM domain-containing protein n=1 Tax=Malus baccata TaxID=106549 RepID=A0A540LW56_MALBA|nr:hypothetical protein C1H46_023785 [Malus baccata]